MEENQDKKHKFYPMETTLVDPNSILNEILKLPDDFEVLFCERSPFHIPRRRKAEKEKSETMIQCSFTVGIQAQDESGC